MNLLWTKTLETERLLLHKTEEKDLKELWKILCIEDISKYYLTTKLHYNWEDEKEWQYKKLEEASNNDVFRRTIEIKNSNQIIGQITLPEEPDSNDMEIRDIWWFINPEFQKNWYAYEAAIEILKYMFLKVGIKLIRTTSAINNTNSWKLMEKLGFRRLDQTKFVKYTLINQEVEAYKYEFNKEDFTKNILRK